MSQCAQMAAAKYCILTLIFFSSHSEANMRFEGNAYEAVEACRHVLSTSDLWADEAAFQGPPNVPHVMYLCPFLRK